jgi:hypothetical protein
MANWTEPVFDRTQTDVDYARTQIRQGINNAQYKGCLNARDLGRIELNTRYLADELIQLYYFSNLSPRKTWGLATIPYSSDVYRIIYNVESLWGAYGKPPDARELPKSLLTFEEVNTIEYNLYLLKEMLDDMISSFRKCGTFGCGEV